MNYGLIASLLAFLAAFLGVFAVNLVLVDVLERHRRRRIKELEEETMARQREKARSSIVEMGGPSLRELADEAREQEEQVSLRERLSRMLEQADMQLTVVGLAMYALGLCVVGAAVVTYFSGSLILGLFVGVTLSVLPIIYVHMRRAQRAEKLRSQLPDSLELMSRVLRAGQSMPQAMQAVAQEFSPPVSSEFGYCYEQQNLGLSPELALRDLAKRTGLLEIKILVMALLVHRQAGGNLTELLDKLSIMIRERFRIRGKIKALTAEGRLQALILLALPPGMYGILLLISRDYALELLEHPGLIAGALVSMCFGAVWIRKIVNFDF